MPTFTTHKGRVLSDAEVRAVVMEELRRWRDFWPCVATTERRKAMADKVLASRELAWINGSVARPWIGDVVLQVVVDHHINGDKI